MIPGAFCNSSYENSYNISLVLGLAAKLGIDRDFALKEMADRVVPTSACSRAFRPRRFTRRLEFTNGMSANERFGTISNWARTGFDRQDFLKEPHVWLTTVVNNRADRIPRSQVFARVLVNDISADRHVLIGGNLNGLLGYIREAWAERAPQISLWKDPARPNSADALKVLEQQALYMRLPVHGELIQTHLRLMLKAQPQISNVEELVANWEKPDALKSQLEPLKLGEIVSGILNNLQHELKIIANTRRLPTRCGNPARLKPPSSTRSSASCCSSGSRASSSWSRIITRPAIRSWT
jgi:hypothetical protein